jgi:hypothetical protein
MNARIGAVAVLFLVCVHAKAQQEFKLPATSAQSEQASLLAKQVTPCIYNSDTTRQWPRSKAVPETDEYQYMVPLTGPGLVSDGHSHFLFVAANGMFVVRVGGIAGDQVVFGPLPISTACATR